MCLVAWHLIQLCRCTCCRLKHTLLCCSASLDELALQVRQFIDKLAPGSLVADVGCGNGKYFLVRQDIAVLGSDRSSGLAEVAATRLAAGTGAASGTPYCITSLLSPLASLAASPLCCPHLQALLHHLSVAPSCKPCCITSGKPVSGTAYREPHTARQAKC